MNVNNTVTITTTTTVTTTITGKTIISIITMIITIIRVIIVVMVITLIYTVGIDTDIDMNNHRYLFLYIYICIKTWKSTNWSTIWCTKRIEEKTVILWCSFGGCLARNLLIDCFNTWETNNIHIHRVCIEQTLFNPVLHFFTCWASADNLTHPDLSDLESIMNRQVSPHPGTWEKRSSRPVPETSVFSPSNRWSNHQELVESH